MASDKRWNIIETDDQKAGSLSDSLGINQVLSKILVQREVYTYDDAKRYFRPQLTDLHNPWLMKDMNAAVERILLAFQKKEKILVFGDYDVDGTTAVACVVDFLYKIYSKNLVDYYIPDRYREGYGVSKAGIDYAAQNNFQLIICLDCGIRSVELIKYASTSGIDFIICDHHVPGDVLPPAIAILNPKQSDCNYPYKELCGCGIGFKLITALAHKLHLDESTFICYLDLVVTAIAADIVPVTGENRILAYYGLLKLNTDPGVGIAALIHSSRHKRCFTLKDVAFMIAPRVNAAGRMDDAAIAVALFLETNKDAAAVSANLLNDHNLNRKKIEQEIIEQATEVLESDSTLLNKNSIVIFNEGWHKGVVGIVAARLIEKYYRPTVVLAQSEQIITGSARSVHGFDLYEAVHSCREHLIGYGGHFAAAGLSLDPDNMMAFSKSFDDAVSAKIEPHMLVPFININAELHFKYIKSGFYNIICQMEPFGPQNAKPVFVSRGVTDAGYSKIVKEDHVRFILKQDEIILTGIGFNLAGKFYLLKNNRIDVVYTLDENEWDNQKIIQLKVIDICISQDPQC